MKWTVVFFFVRIISCGEQEIWEYPTRASCEAAANMMHPDTLERGGSQTPCEEKP